jgi:hypothetical protein
MSEHGVPKTGHTPSKVQGGYIPPTSASPPPPKGGSAVKAPPK